MPIHFNPDLGHCLLVDVGFYHHFRYFATSSWWNKAHADTPLQSLEGDLADTFRESMVRQHTAHLAKVFKLIGNSDNVFFLRDSPQDTLWRRRIYSSYKANRESSSPPGKVTKGPFIKHLNTHLVKTYPGRIWRQDGLEADDLIYLVTLYIRKVLMTRNIDPSTFKVYILTEDRDIFQLVAKFPLLFYQVSVRGKGAPNLKYLDAQLSEYQNLLQIKALTGDKSDNITGIMTPSVAQGLLNLNRSDLVNHLYHSGQLRKYLDNLEQVNFSYINRHISYLPFFNRNIGKPVQLGLCCLNTSLQSQKPRIFCGRKCILDSIRKHGISKVLDCCQGNCQDLVKMVKWNIANRIKVFRMSSGLFPHYRNPKANEILDIPSDEPLYHLDQFQPYLTEVGNLARKHGMRLTFHPGQYNVVGTPHADIFQKTVNELSMHAEILDRMLQDSNSVMVVHGGGTYGDKQATIQRWIDNFRKLPLPVRRRLVLENCERDFHIEDCLNISEEIHIPVVFDTHHHECYILNHPDCGLHDASYYMSRILETWTRRGIKPKFHVSTQAPGKRVGAHADFIDRIPDYLLEIPQKYGINIDIMIEAKLKEQAIDDLYLKHPGLKP